MKLWLVATWVALGAAQAAAGAWPRAPGSGFVSVGFEVATTREALSSEGLEEDPSPDFTGYRTLYAEYGLTPRLTFGIDAGQDDADTGDWAGRQMTSTLLGLPSTDGSEDATDWRQKPTWSGIVFLRRALRPPEARHQFALALGMGLRSYEKAGLFFGRETIETEAILRPAAAWGMGFGSPMGPGWLAVDSSVEFRADTGGRAVKLDAVAGLKPEGRYTYLFQVQSGDYPGAAPFVKLVPGLVMALGRGISVETSAIWGLSGTDAVGAKVAIWVEW